MVPQWQAGGKGVNRCGVPGTWWPLKGAVMCYAPWGDVKGNVVTASNLTAVSINHTLDPFRRCLACVHLPATGCGL